MINKCILIVISLCGINLNAAEYAASLVAAEIATFSRNAQILARGFEYERAHIPDAAPVHGAQTKILSLMKPNITEDELRRGVDSAAREIRCTAQELFDACYLNGLIIFNRSASGSFLRAAYKNNALDAFLLLRKLYIIRVTDADFAWLEKQRNKELQDAFVKALDQ